MGMCSNVPQTDLDRLRNGGTPYGIPLDDSEVIEDWCKRWVSLSQGQREIIIRRVSNRADLSVNALACKYLTELGDPVNEFRRLNEAQIRRVVELLRITPVH